MSARTFLSRHNNVVAVTVLVHLAPANQSMEGISMTTVTVSFRLGNNAALRARVLPKVDAVLRTLGCKAIQFTLVNR